MPTNVNRLLLNIVHSIIMERFTELVQDLDATELEEFLKGESGVDLNAVLQFEGQDHPQVGVNLFLLGSHTVPS